MNPHRTSLGISNCLDESEQSKVVWKHSEIIVREIKGRELLGRKILTRSNF
jgi:hypothetical protein